MSAINLLGLEWKKSLANLIGSVDSDLLITSPYVTNRGAMFVSSHFPQGFKDLGKLVLLTDLSPLPICQGSTDPSALRLLSQDMQSVLIYHLPRVHAKVYVADGTRAIVTSGNLTAGGLDINYEYGVEVTDHSAVSRIRKDLMDYAELGASVSQQRLVVFCEIADKVRQAFRNQLSGIAGAAQEEFKTTFQTVEDELLRLRLAEGPIHTVFAKTIWYLLNKKGPTTTDDMHNDIQALHPDLCDDNVDRIIDGKRFGKKWKHAVRTAQQMLKKKGQIELSNGVWRATAVNAGTST